MAEATIPCDIETFWINVDSHVIRRTHIHGELSKHGINEKNRIKAYEPSTLPPIRRKEPNYANELAYARMCSHMKAQVEGLKTEAQWFLIIEDDMVFLEGLGGLESLIKSAPRDAEVLQLFCSNPNVYGGLMASDSTFIPWSAEKWHVGAYLISRSGAQKNVDTWRSDGVTYDFRTSSYPTNPEAVVFSQRKSYTATHMMFCVNETIRSVIYPDHFVDQIYANFMIRAIRNLQTEGQTFVFVVSAGSFVSRSKELVDILNNEVYIHIDTESLPVLPWDVKEDNLNAKIKQLQRQKKTHTGDSANYLLPYFPMLLQKLGNRVRMVCLRDNRSDCVNAYMKNTPSRNHWMDHDGDTYAADSTWDKCFPTYPPTLLKSDLIGKYWDEFYELSQQFQDSYPEQFRIFSSKKLNIESVYKFIDAAKRVPR